MMNLLSVRPTVRATAVDRLKLVYILLLVAVALMELGSRVDSRAATSRPKLPFDLLVRPCRIIADQIVKDAHVAIDSLQELLLVLLHFALDCGLSGLHLLLDERMYVFLDTCCNVLKLLLGLRHSALDKP